MSGGAIACGLAVIINGGSTMDVTHWANLHDAHDYCVETNACTPAQLAEITQARNCEWEHIKRLLGRQDIVAIKTYQVGDRHYVGLDRPFQAVPPSEL